MSGTGCSRRAVLRGFACAAACALAGPAWGAGTALPVLMFHKVEDAPRYPEDISPAQLEALFCHLWRSGYRPVNVSDILAGAVDRVVPRGCKPLGITVDDAHRSVLFPHPERDIWGSNSRSLLEVLAASLAPYRAAPRASLFLSRVNDDRVSTRPDGYFGGARPLRALVSELPLPGVELGYHTLTHTRMTGMDAKAVRDLIEAQRADFQRAGVLEAVAPILAYPYGCPPTARGVAALRDLGFKGAVLAFPGVREGRYIQLPRCAYAEGGLGTDPFFVPRVAVGAWTYTAKGAPDGPYAPVAPLEDFRKDVETDAPPCYVSRGGAAG